MCFNMLRKSIDESNEMVGDRLKVLYGESSAYLVLFFLIP